MTNNSHDDRASIESGILSAAERRVQDEWYRAKLRGLLQLPNKQYAELLPKNGTVSSPLVEAICKVYTKSLQSINGVTYVAYAPPCFGKSVAASYLLNSFVAEKNGIPRGLMIRGGKAGAKNIHYVDVVSKAIDAPTTYADGKESGEWILTLFHALAGTLAVSPGTWLQNFLKEKLRSCRDETEIEEPPIESERGKFPPVLVFDDFAGWDDRSEGFVKEVYQWAQKKRVLVFILTDDRKVAYNLCQLNGLQRIKPLPGSFDNRTKLTIGCEIKWNGMSWSLEQLTKLVQHNYPEFTDSSPYMKRGVLTFLRENMSPFEANEAAAELVEDGEGDVAPAVDGGENATPAA